MKSRWSINKFLFHWQYKQIGSSYCEQRNVIQAAYSVRENGWSNITDETSGKWDVLDT